MKYKFPIIKLNAQVVDKNDTTRSFSKMFFFLVNTTYQHNQQIIFQIEYKFGLDAKSTLDKSEPFLKVGEIVLNRTIYPTDRFDLITSNQHFSLKSNGSLYVDEKVLLGLLIK